MCVIFLERRENNFVAFAYLCKICQHVFLFNTVKFDSLFIIWFCIYDDYIFILKLEQIYSYTYLITLTNHST